MALRRERLAVELRLETSDVASAIEVIRRGRTDAWRASGVVSKVRDDGSITAWSWRIWYSPRLTGRIVERQGRVVLTGTVRESRLRFAGVVAGAVATALLAAACILLLAMGGLPGATAIIPLLLVTAVLGGLTFVNWSRRPVAFARKAQRLLDGVRDLAPIERHRPGQHPGRRRTPA